MEQRVDRESVLRLLCDYLQKNGLLATLTALEEECQLRPSFPATARLRSMALAGKWRELEEQFLSCHEEREEQHELYKMCHFSLAKQQYLETVAELDKVSRFRETSVQERAQVTSCLQKIKKLSLSKEEYDQLSALSDSPSDFFDSWNLRKARTEVYRHLLSWCIADCGRVRGGGGGGGGERYCEGGNDIHKLVVLLVKGKMYEDCEKVFHSRSQCQGGEGRGGEMIDMCSWLSSQPDSVFQESPRTTRIITNPPLLTGSEMKKKIGDDSGSHYQNNPGSPLLPPAPLHQTKPAANHQKPPEKSLSKETAQELRTSEKSLEKEREVLGVGVVSHKENIEAITDRLRQSLREDEVLNSNPPPPPPPNTQSLSFETNFIAHPAPLPLLSLTPLTTPLLAPRQRPGRKSSTPKPSIHRHISSPPTSPVPYIPLGDSTNSNKEENHIAEGTSGGPSASWPSAKLVGRVIDSQAVRAVAFSESGQLVAVGANSKCLWILSTTSLLDNENEEEMVVLQEMARYHRGSIYTLSWSGDRLLASGSNDKTIKLTTPSSSDQWMETGRLSFHKGTVRELVFLSDTLLLSGGSGTPSLVLSDCSSLKIVRSLSGQDKVLSVAQGGQSSTAVSGGEDGSVMLWDWNSGSCVHSLSLSDPVTSLSISSHSMATALGDGSCSVYDMRIWKEVFSYQPHSDECRSVRYSPCSNWLLTSSYDGSVCLGEAAGGEWMEIAQHQDKVIQSRWHPSGDLFSSTSSDKTVSFWSLHH